MKNLNPFFFLLFLLSGQLLNSQASCDVLTNLIDDNLDGYSEGAVSEQSDHWTTFSGTEGGDEEGVITSLIVNSEPNSMVFGDSYGSSSQNAVLKLGDISDGMAVVKFSLYVVPSFSAQIGGSHLEGELSAEKAFSVNFDTDGVGTLMTGGEIEVTFPYDQEEWLNGRFVFDLDNDFAYFFLDNDFIAGWSLSINLDGSVGSMSMGAINFETRTSADLFFLDDIIVDITSAAVGGKFCHLATPIDVGTHEVGQIECYGAGFTIRDAGQGQKGEWFSYTPTENGTIAIGSCLSGEDTRVWIFSGGCEILRVEGVNDDQCLIEEGSEDDYASYREVVVNAGVTYYILWDDVWEASNFTFDLSFSSEDLVPGNFCESAIPLENGQTTISEIDGHGAVSGPNINHTAASTTNYAKSEWYTFTPPTDGFINIATCFLASNDTRLWVYRGECGIANLELVAFDDDGCELQSIVADLPVEAEVQYYFEWDDEALESPGFTFLFEFEIESSTDNLLRSNESISIFPNPVDGIATVDIQFEVYKDINIEVYDNVGKLCQKDILKNITETEHKLDFSQMRGGIYFVKLFSNDGTSLVKKVVVH